jgi:hypothetical protein
MNTHKKSDFLKTKALFFLLFLNAHSINAQFSPHMQNIELYQFNYKFTYHQPLWGLIHLDLITQDYCSDADRYIFTFHGYPTNRSLKNNPILKNFDLTISIKIQPHNIIFVEAYLKSNGSIITTYGQEPLNITIPFNGEWPNDGQQDIEEHLLDDCITQYLEITLFFESENHFYCAHCRQPLWSSDENDHLITIDQHALTADGMFYCDNCSPWITTINKSNAIFISSITLPQELVIHGRSRLELAQQYGGVW